MGTLDYYNDHTEEFVSQTQSVDMTSIQDRFIGLVKAGGHILDFGCGSGRDTKYFLSKGFSVTATDGSEELCREASRYAGIRVRRLLFTELDETEAFDGIWACASVLHAPHAELPDIFRRMERALKPGGILYVSFKYGDFEGERSGRYYTDMKEDSFGALVRGVPSIKVRELWVTGDVRPGRETEKWLNAILRKE